MILGYKLIDCLTGHSKLWRHLESNFGTRSGELSNPGRQGLLELAALLRNAEKFDFGVLPLEPGEAVESVVPGAPPEKGWHVPGLSEAEQEAWRLGLIPLPAPIVWYEYHIGKSRSGLLVQDDGDRWLVRMVDFTPDEGVFSYNTIVLGVSKIEAGNDVFHLAAGHAFFQWLKERSAEENLASKVVLEYGIKPMGGIALYLTLMLLSRTTEVRLEPLTAKERLANAGRAKPKYSPHTIVTIVPKQYIDRGERLGGTHASPRLHWRRSHLRHFDHATPGSVWAAEHEHLGKKGWWLTVIPRFLVGVREMGEVSHEYFVKQQKEVTS